MVRSLNTMLGKFITYGIGEEVHYGQVVEERRPNHRSPHATQSEYFFQEISGRRIPISKRSVQIIGDGLVLKLNSPKGATQNA